MATNEVALYAKLYTEQFEASSKKLDAMIADLDKNLTNFEKNQQKSAEQRTKAEQDAFKKQSKLFSDMSNNIKKYSAAAGESFDSFVGSIGVAAQGIGIATAAIGAMAVALKGLIDIGRQTAPIVQLGDSFTRMMGGEKKAADELERLRIATHFTMTGSQMMAPIMRMLTGSEAEFADKIKENTQLLFEMAAASAKLNPTMGTTSDVLDTMAVALESGTSRGLKRLGIVVDTTKEEKKLADSLGVTVDQLDEEQKKLAMLNGVLEYHDTLMRQVGGTVESALDPFARLDVATTTISTKFKTMLVPAAAAAAEAIANFLTWNEKLGARVNQEIKGVETSSQTYEEYVRGVLKAREAITGYEQSEQTVNQILAELADNNADAAKEFRVMTQAEWESAKATEELNRQMDAWGGDDRRQVIESMRHSVESAAEGQRILVEKQTQYAEKLQSLQIKTGESLLSAEQDYQNKSADAWRDYMQKTADIVADGIKERTKIQQQYQDKISEAERDYQRGIENLNYSHGQKMADIERNYQDAIRNIQQTYQEDALDAIRNLDAIALIRAREKRDKDMASARQDRDKSMSDEERDYQHSLYELVRALQDKKQEADDARQRDLEEQRRNEQEKTQAAKDAYSQQMADAQQAFNDKITSIRGQYAQEDAEAQAHYLNQENQLVAHLNAMQAIIARYNIGTGGGATSPVRNPRGGFRRQEGGVDVVSSPTQFIAGEAGPELAIFAPLNRALPSPVMQTVNHVGDFQHSLDASISSSVVGLDGRILAAVRKALGEVIK